MKRDTTPTAEHIILLQQAKKYYGKMWRDKLDVAWYSGNYAGLPNSHLFQQMRNDPRRNWNVDTVKVPGEA